MQEVQPLRGEDLRSRPNIAAPDDRAHLDVSRDKKLMHRPTVKAPVAVSDRLGRLTLQSEKKDGATGTVSTPFDMKGPEVPLSPMMRSISAPPQLSVNESDSVNDANVAPDDPRLTPEYFAYYYSQRPLDPRLPRPLFDFARWNGSQIFQAQSLAKSVEHIPVHVVRDMIARMDDRHQRRDLSADAAILGHSWRSSNSSEATPMLGFALSASKKNLSSFSVESKGDALQPSRHASPSLRPEQMSPLSAVRAVSERGLDPDDNEDLQHMPQNSRMVKQDMEPIHMDSMYRGLHFDQVPQHMMYPAVPHQAQHPVSNMYPAHQMQPPAQYQSPMMPVMGGYGRKSVEQPPMYLGSHGGPMMPPNDYQYMFAAQQQAASQHGGNLIGAHQQNFWPESQGYPHMYGVANSHPSMLPFGGQGPEPARQFLGSLPHPQRGVAHKQRQGAPRGHFPGESFGNSQNFGITDLNMSPRSRIIEKLRLNKSTGIKLEDIINQNMVCELSMDQNGSRFIQQQLQTATPHEKDLIFQQLQPNIFGLCLDLFGNYVVQRLFEHGLPEHRRVLAQQLVGQVLSLTIHVYGCRVMQKAIEVSDEETQAMLVRELRGHVIKCVKDQNGNHVIQKCLEKVPPKHIMFIVEGLQGEAVLLAKHSYGCRVLQRLLENCPEELTSMVLEELLDSTLVLMVDSYGNYVVQHIIQRGSQKLRSAVIDAVLGHVESLSKHKFASNVIEKCVVHGSPADREKLITEVIGNELECPIMSMVKDQYANFVVQKMLLSATDAQRQSLIDTIRVRVPNLRKITYGKHIVNKIEKLTGVAF